jgi:prolyl 4-hydroxylase
MGVRPRSTTTHHSHVRLCVAILAGIVLFLESGGATALTFQTRCLRPGRALVRARTTLLQAKKKTSQTKSTRASGGGFGSGVVVSSKQKGTSVRDDYALFPALESEVQATIVPAPSDWQSAGPLPPEVMDRLSQIYGLDSFNGGAFDSGEDAAVVSPAAEATSPLSLESLLMVTDEEDDEIEENDTSSVSSTTRRRMRQAIESLPPFTEFRILHLDPLVLAVDEFLTAAECQRYVALAQGGTAAYTQGSPTVGTTAQARAQRTSTTWYHSYERVPEVVTKACRLVGVEDADGWEEVQTVRYQRNQEFTWHLDALGPDAVAAADSAGQRMATLLVYLTDDITGGATIFRDLDLQVQPKLGTALLFFPAAGGIPGVPTDFRTLHCGQKVQDTSPQDKWIAQMWLRPRPYEVTVGTSHTDPVVAAAMRAYAESYVTQMPAVDE